MKFEPVSKKQLLQISTSQEIKSLTKPSKKLEDLENILKIKNTICAQQPKSSDSEKETSTDSSQKVQIAKYFTLVSNKYYLGCLVKSIGAISESTFASKAGNLAPAWNVIAQLPVDGKMDMLFSFLLYRFSKSLFGKSFRGEIPVSHFLSVLENYNSNLSSVISCLHLMSASRDNSADLDLVLDRKCVETLKSRFSYLVTRLAESGHLVSDFGSPFYSEDNLNKDLLEVFKSQLSNTLVILMNHLIACVIEGHGFEKVFKGEINGQISEGSIEKTRKAIGLMNAFCKAFKFFLEYLDKEENKQILRDHVTARLAHFEEKSTKFYKMKNLFDKETSQKLREKLVA